MFISINFWPTIINYKFKAENCENQKPFIPISPQDIEFVNHLNFIAFFINPFLTSIVNPADMDRPIRSFSSTSVVSYRI